MQILLRLGITALSIGVFADWCTAQETTARPNALTASLGHADDYAFGFYPEGWRRPSNQGNIRFAVQTNQYAMLFDATRACVERLGVIAAPLEALQAVTQGNDLLETLPTAKITFSAIWNGREFPATQGAGAADQMRLIHSGKYLQHFSVQPVQLGGLSAGAGLEGVQAWLESYCWNDRISWILHVANYENHLTPPQNIQNLSYLAAVEIPAEYPIIEMLGDSDSWRPAEPGDTSARAVLMRSEAGEGIALLAVPETNQEAKFSTDRRLLIESKRLDSPIDRVNSIPCIIVPARNIREAALREMRQMEHPCSVFAEGLSPYTGPLPVSYNPVKGWYQILLGENADKEIMERVRVNVENPGNAPKTIRLNFAKVGGGFSITGMSPVLRSPEGYPLGLPVQISKNWHCAPPWFNGIAMFDFEPGQKSEVEFDLAYSRWGGVPAVSHAQLCLVGYGGNQVWDEMAIGSFGESICYDPDVNLNRSMIDDMRPLMVSGMGKEPKIKWSWSHNVGGCDFLTLFKMGDRERQYLTRMKTLYSAYGPVMSDVTYAGEIRGGALQARMRAQSWRSDDYVRALYTLRYDAVKTVNNIRRLAFFQLGADHYNGLQFKQMARGSINGLEDAWEPPFGGNAYSRRGEPLTGEMPWLGIYEVQKEPPQAFPEGDQGAVADKAMIIRSWHARLEGKECPLPCYSVYGSQDGIPSALIELSPPKDLTRIESGDYVEAQVEVLILPQKAEDYYGPNQNLINALTKQTSPWELTLREAKGSAVTVEATEGVVEQRWPVCVRAERGERAEFTIAGGIGYTPVTITGAKQPGGFLLKTALGANPFEVVDHSSATGNDWWQSKYQPATGTWDLTFTLPLDTPADTRNIRRFQWSCVSDSAQK